MGPERPPTTRAMNIWQNTGRRTVPYAPRSGRVRHLRRTMITDMIEMLTSAAYDCIGCTEYDPAAGFDQLFFGLLVTAFAMAPVALLHNLLRRRGH